jgi:hypothetical protein
MNLVYEFKRRYGSRQIEIEIRFVALGAAGGNDFTYR